MADDVAEPTLPDYKGAPIDPGLGPGLGCFWIQVGLLVALLIATPLSVIMAAPSWLSAALLIIVLVVLLFVGQTLIFLLRLVAADRRTRRRPLSSSARQTVGQIEDESAHAPGRKSATTHADQGGASSGDVSFRDSSSGDDDRTL